MYLVYVLESLKSGVHYIGMTEKSIQERVARHNRGDYRFTKMHRPWQVIYQEEVSSRSEAVKRERFLKSGIGRQELKKILVSLNQN